MMAEENDAEEIEQENAELNLHSVGDMLRHAREQKNLNIEDIAKTTRIPQRHLESIETGDFAALPGRTYAIGFAKSYARTVGLSEVTIGSQLREEMDDQGHSAYEPETSGYAPANPSNIPPKYLAWTAGGIAAVLLIGFLVWRTLFLEPADFIDEGPEAEFTESETIDGTLDGTIDPVGPTPSDTGTVTLTATETVWLKIYDEDGERLFEKEMSAGEQYSVPADAKGPQILTGRPDALTVTIDGAVVAPLGTADRTIKDVGISAAALLARTDPGGSTTNGESASELDTTQ
ncbi:RodZ domain-containing protein [Sphingorhabdus sp. EL138]|uniref:helix-turn-helix domain-containing protein n=1 Tax=Sphingorhabdus sp. EL138 TaxID=2073156 RepID=UPI000D695F9D|nr:RodZ domain-containing protein [Sphingorhabdus sp. EL138]